MVRLVRKRFSRQGSRNGMEDLLELRQNGLVDEYIEVFEFLSLEVTLFRLCSLLMQFLALDPNS
jgi:hypothetical protein